MCKHRCRENTYTCKTIKEKHTKLETECPFRAEMKQSLHLLCSAITPTFRHIPTVINFNICFLLHLAHWIKWWTCVLHIHTNHLSHNCYPSRLPPALLTWEWSTEWKSHFRKQLKPTTEHHQTKPNPQNCPEKPDQFQGHFTMLCSEGNWPHTAWWGC